MSSRWHRVQENHYDLCIMGNNSLKEQMDEDSSKTRQSLVKIALHQQSRMGKLIGFSSFSANQGGRFNLSVSSCWLSAM